LGVLFRWQKILDWAHPFNALMQHAKTCNTMHVLSIQMIYSTTCISQSIK
jgi:hypothetical protein